MAVFVTEDLVIPEGESRTYIQNNDNGYAAALMIGGTNSPDLINYGSIYFDNPLPSTGIFLYFESFSGSYMGSQGVIQNYGLISAVTPDNKLREGDLLAFMVPQYH